MWKRQSLKKFNVANQTIAIERYQTKKLNMSTLDKIVSKRYRYNGFREYDVILTISLEFSLRVAIPLDYVHTSVYALSLFASECVQLVNWKIWCRSPLREQNPLRQKAVAVHSIGLITH